MQRPTSVMVFGILNIVFGAMEFLGTLLSFLLIFLMPQIHTALPNSSAIDIVMRTPFLRTWSIGVGIVSIIATIVLIAAGIGLLRMKPWGRVASLGYAIYALCAGIIGQIINYIFLFGPLMEEARRSNAPGAASFTASYTFGSGLGGCTGLIYPILLFICMTRPGVVQAFRPSNLGRPQPM